MRQVDYLQELNRDARPTIYKKKETGLFECEVWAPDRQQRSQSFINTFQNIDACTLIYLSHLEGKQNNIIQYVHFTKLNEICKFSSFNIIT